jgi:hypothetical protein
MELLPGPALSGIGKVAKSTKVGRAAIAAGAKGFELVGKAFTGAKTFVAKGIGKLGGKKARGMWLVTDGGKTYHFADEADGVWRQVDKADAEEFIKCNTCRFTPKGTTDDVPTAGGKAEAPLKPEASAPSASKAKPAKLSRKERRILNEIEGEVKNAGLKWDDLDVPNGDIDRFLEKYDDPMEGIAELNRRWDRKLDVGGSGAGLGTRGEPSGGAAEPGELTQAAGRPAGTTKGTPKQRAQLRENEIQGELGEARSAMQVTGGALPPDARQFFPGKVFEDLMEQVTSGKMTLKEFAELMPPGGLRQVPLRVPGPHGPTTRRVDHMRLEKGKAVLGEVKTPKKDLDIDSSEALRKQVDADLWLARRQKNVVIEWRINGPLTKEAKKTFKLLMKENPGIFRVVPPGVLK